MADTDRFYVTLRDVEGTNDPFTVLYKVNDRFGTVLEKLYNQILGICNMPMKKTFMLQGWQTSWEDTEYTRNVLL